MIRFKSIFVSDVHLGTRGCSADDLLGFFRETDSDELYLVGDIVDMWQLSKRFYWPRAHNEIVQKILRKSRKGTRVVYVPGNHDEKVRDFLPLMLGDIECVEEADYITVTGERLLITHGDLYDIITTYHAWLARLGDTGYTWLIGANRWLNWVQRRLKMKRWSLSRYVKTKVKNAASFIGKFEEALAQTCQARGYQGIIAGHIHHAEMRVIDGVRYFNDGDFVESCTALAEHHDGRFVLLEWRDGSLLETAEWPPHGEPVVHSTPRTLFGPMPL